MIEAIFEGARTHCKAHPHKLLGPKEMECDDCKLLRYNMSFSPPFRVKCDRTHFDLKKDEIYNVIWIIRDGARQYSDHMSGYVLTDSKGNPVKQIYDPIAFTPIVEEKQEVLPECWQC